MFKLDECDVKGWQRKHLINEDSCSHMHGSCFAFDKFEIKICSKQT
jgi:hypothetical protein